MQISGFTAKPQNKKIPSLAYGKLFTEEAAHLFRDVCECGRMKLWTKSSKTKTYDQGSQERLLYSSTKNSLIFDNPSSDDRPDKLGSIIIIIALVFTVLFLFWIRNIDLIMKNNQSPN